MSIAQKSLAILATAAVSAAIVVSFAATISTAEAATLTSGQIQSIVSLLQSFGVDAATIANVQATLSGQPTSGTGSSTGGACPTLTRDLTLGSTGSDVQALQKFLNSNASTQLAVTGAGSPGLESTYFGPITKAAVIKFQTANNVSPNVGYVGSITRAAIAAVCGSTTTNPPPVSAGTGLTVAAGVQPTSSLAPQGAARVPFTRFTLTAGNDGDVTVNGVTIQRSAFGSDADFSGVILIDEATGQQLGNALTFNANHQATIGGTFTVPRGTTRSYLIAGNMAADLSSHTGETPSISVVAINTSATVSGSLPITGATQTTNASLSIGSMTVNTSNAYSPNSNQSPAIGATGVKTTGLRLTAGSAEDITLKWVRFNQTGSVASGDLGNVAVNIGGTSYPMTVSADGKYYSASLGSGVVIPKGNQVEMYVQYDVVGGNSNNRTVIFDVDKTTDIFATGNTYGYGISPTAPSNVSVPTSRGTLTLTSGTPYAYATQDTIKGASVTTISKATEVPAQNIAINVPNQPLGGFVVDLVGESMTVDSLAVTVATSSGSGTGVLTNVTLVDENGAVIAGPYDANSAGTTVTFSSSITFPAGRHVYRVLGKVASGIGNGTVYTLSTDPSTQWSSPKGETSGDSISLAAQTSFSMNAMTVESATITIGRASSPASQTLVPGGTSVLMANFQFDATQSGEDVRFGTAKVMLHGNGTFTADESKLTACQLFDGTTPLNTGSNIFNPSTATATSSDPFLTGSEGSMTLDNPVTVAKGTVKTLGMRCNISATADSNSTFSWDVQNASGWSFTGATSGVALSGSELNDSTDSAVVVTIGAGGATVATDASSPGYSNVAAGSTGVTIGAYKFHASNEALNLTKLGVQISSTASSSASDLAQGKFYVYNGSTLVGSGSFTGNQTSATSTLTGVQIPKDSDLTLTIKADIGAIGTGQAATSSGHLLVINYLNAQGTGADSGTTENLAAAAGSTSVSGVRIFRSVPTIALDSISSTGVADGDLMKFKVTADASGPVSISNLAINVATSSFASGGGVSNITIYGYTDSSYSTPISGVSGSGDLQATDDCVGGCTAGNFSIGITDSAGSPTTVQVPAGQTRYFKVHASVSGAQSGTSVTTILKGNSSFPSTGAIVGGDFLVATSSASLTKTTDLIWSPNSTTTSDNYAQDWTNGYGVTGLPSGGLTQTRSQ